MSELVFNRHNSLLDEDVLLFCNIVKRFNIHIEEQLGLNSCSVTVHNFMHIADDVFQFSHPVFYWCFPFERAVKRYIGISSNFKNAECSFASCKSHRELLKLVRSKLEPLEVNCFKIVIKKVGCLFNLFSYFIVNWQTVAAAVAVAVVVVCTYIDTFNHLVIESHHS